YVVGVATDQFHRANYQYQDHGEHDGILSDILPLLVFPKIAEKLNHTPSGLKNKFAQTCVRNNDDSDGDCQSRPRLIFPLPAFGAETRNRAASKRKLFFAVPCEIETKVLSREKPTTPSRSRGRRPAGWRNWRHNRALVPVALRAKA